MPELHAVLRGWFLKRGAEGENLLPCPTRHAAGDAVQGMLGFLGCKHTLLGHVSSVTHQYLQVQYLQVLLLFSIHSSPSLYWNWRLP